MAEPIDNHVKANGDRFLAKLFTLRRPPTGGSRVGENLDVEHDPQRARGRLRR